MGATPVYELMDEKGPDHSKCFEVAVTIDGKRFPGAWGPNKKAAEQKAARYALEELGVLEPEDDVACAVTADVVPADAHETSRDEDADDHETVYAHEDDRFADVDFGEEDDDDTPAEDDSESARGRR
jgi:hypothetical protein